ncbi:beta strand repeat-containing protein [Massilia niastensis]|uniref:beta strand repeat-containing protein n=1 Tax=Massilia niastensis TaxID=544911 RepID=UPI00039D51A3|nr:calcium-binding protein [Massilia niastensis]
MATLTGTSSTDTYTGDPAVHDTAVIDTVSPFATFRLDQSAANRWTVTSTQGVDTLVNVDAVKFLDSSIALSSQRPWFSTTTSYGVTVVPTKSGGYIASNGSSARFLDANGLEIGPEIPLALRGNVPGNSAPVLAALSSGGFVGVSGAYNSATQRYELLAQRFDAAGAKVGDAIKLSDSTLSYSYENVSAIGAADGGFRVAFDFYSSGSGYTAPKVVSVDATATQVTTQDIVAGTSVNGSMQSFVETAALPGGGFVASFVALNNYIPELYVQRFSAGGTPNGEPIRVSSSYSNSGDSAAVAVLGDGSFAVTWLDKSRVLQVKQYDAQGVAKGEDFTLAPSNQQLGYQLYNPEIAALGDGGYLLLWNELDPYYRTYTVHGQRFDVNGVRVDDEITFAWSSNAVLNVQATAIGANGYALSVRGSTMMRFEEGHDTQINGILTGDANPNTIVYAGFDAVKLSGGAGDDVLTGNRGADILIGGSGADKLTGGLGNDTYVADTLDTIVEEAGGGTDMVRIAGNYTLGRNIEEAWLLGSGGYSLIGNSSANHLIGNIGANTLNGGGGADRMEGGSGDDTYIVDNVGDQVREDAPGGVDSVTSSVSHVLSDNVENLRLSGSQNINATGNAQNNRLVGNNGNNRLDGGAGEDLLIGGAGNDTYMVDGRDIVQEDEAGGTDTVQASGSTTLGDNLEILSLTGTLNIAGTGNELDNTIYGNSGNNVLNGMEGVDTVNGGDGSDTIYVDNTADIVIDTGYSGTDHVKATATYQIGSGIENLTLVGSLAIDGSGNSANNQIVGNSADNVLVGGGGSDRLVGGFGNDTLYANNKDELYWYAEGDVLLGGAGNDNYYVTGDTSDVVELANQGADTVYALVNDSYALGAHLENLVLLGGDVNATGNELGNKLTGTAGANTLDGGSGADLMTGLEGDDTYVVDSSADKVVELALGGIDKVISAISYTLGAELENLQLTGSAALSGTGNALDNRITGNRGANVLLAGDGNDTVVGGGGADRIDGGAGNDNIYSSGAETIEGGLGRDSVIYASVGVGVKLDLALGGAQNTTGAGPQVLTGIENITGSATGSDILGGNELANRLVGGGGDDQLDGAAGDDVLDGGEGEDFLTGGLGNDRLVGGVDSDTASYFGATAGVNVNLNLLAAQNTVGAGIDTLIGIENLLGSDAGADSLVGDLEDNILRGYGGNDRLNGEEGSNLLDGRDGNDVFVAYLGDDIIEGGAGIDTVDYSLALESVNVMLASGTRDNANGLGYSVKHDLAPGYVPGATSVAGVASGGGNDKLYDVENATGSAFNDLLVGGDGANVLNGMGGADRMIGGNGSDVYYVDNAGDVVSETTAGATGGTDTVVTSVTTTLGANLENLRITSTDSVNGIGNTLNNTITGGAGANVLTGGAGKDSFVFNTALNASVDTITDFVVVDDTILLENAIFTKLAAGALNAGNLRLGVKALDADDFIVYDSATGALSYDADGSGAGAAVRIALIGTGKALTSLDFVVT